MIMVINNLITAYPKDSSLSVIIPIELEIRNDDSCGGRKTGKPGEEPSRKSSTLNKKLNPHKTASTGHRGGTEASAHPLR